jgi:CheY-like chemotaxis protein
MILAKLGAYVINFLHSISPQAKPKVSRTPELMDQSPAISSPVKGDRASSDKASPQALILVVERNPAVQRLERFLLEKAGYSVEFASDGLSALERARELCPRIVVTEILVPRLDGLSLCRALRSDPKTRSIILLVFSHLHAEDRALEAGADAFMIKPINEDHLIDIVSKLLEISGERAAGSL